MSSFLGHASTGAALFLAQSPLRSPVARLGLPACVLLAIAPDFDYLAYWLLHVNSEPRWTHSLLFALAASLMVWLALRQSGSAARSIAWPWLMAAACSHMLLDLLVGVHPVPVLWPGPQWTSPLGLLPSAGRIDVGNFYFWRNLLIECGVLMPALALFVALARKVPLRRLTAPLIILAPMWIAFVMWSLRIH
jgi:inner membrane protein